MAVPSARGPAFTLYNESSLLIPALTIIVACVIGAQLVSLALLSPSSTPQHIVAVVLTAVLVLTGAFVGVSGLLGWIAFNLQDSPFDDLAGITLVPLMAQTIFGFLVALGAIIYLWMYFAQFDLLAFDEVEPSAHRLRGACMEDERQDLPAMEGQAPVADERDVTEREMPCPVCGHPMPDLKGGKDSICPVCGFKDSCCY